MFSGISSEVVCRQLRYGNPELAKAKDGDIYKAGSAGMIPFLDDVHCAGTESSLAGCAANLWHVKNCVGNRELAAVICETAGMVQVVFWVSSHYYI